MSDPGPSSDLRACPYCQFNLRVVDFQTHVQKCAAKPLAIFDDCMNINWNQMTNEDITKIFEDHLLSQVGYLNIEAQLVEKLVTKFKMMITIEAKNEKGFQAWRWIDKKSHLYKPVRPVEDYTKKLMVTRGNAKKIMEQMFNLFQSFVKEIELHRNRIDKEEIKKPSDAFPDVNDEDNLEIAEFLESQQRMHDNQIDDYNQWLYEQIDFYDFVLNGPGLDQPESDHSETIELDVDEGISPDFAQISPMLTSTPKKSVTQSKQCKKSLFQSQPIRSGIPTPGPRGFSDLSGVVDIDDEHRKQPFYSQKAGSPEYETPPTQPLQRVSSDSIKTASYDSRTYERPAENRSPPTLEEIARNQGIRSPDCPLIGTSPLSPGAEADFDIKAAAEMTQKQGPTSAQITALVNSRPNFTMEEQYSDLPVITNSYVKNMLKDLQEEEVEDFLRAGPSRKQQSQEIVSEQPQKKLKIQETNKEPEPQNPQADTNENAVDTEENLSFSTWSLDMSNPENRMKDVDSDSEDNEGQKIGSTEKN